MNVKYYISTYKITFVGWKILICQEYSYCWGGQTIKEIASYKPDMSGDACILYSALVTPMITISILSFGVLVMLKLKLLNQEHMPDRHFHDKLCNVFDRSASR